jgi:hypothetical protein
MPLLDLKSAAHFWLGRSLPLPPAGPPIDHVDGWHVARAIAINPDQHQKKKRIHTGLCITFRPACRLPAGKGIPHPPARRAAARHQSSQANLPAQPSSRAACRPIAGLRIPRLVTFLPYPYIHSTCVMCVASLALLLILSSSGDSGVNQRDTKIRLNIFSLHLNDIVDV